MASIPPIRTQVDFELEGVPRGPELSDGVRAHRAARSPMAMPPTREPTREPIDKSSSEFTLTWGDLQVRHPDWMGDYWAECRALYAGGPRLLVDQKVLERLFPKHLHEDGMVYAQRKARSHYFPYPGTIIDHLLAGLGTDPLRVTFADVDDDKGTRELSKEAEWWERWVSDVTDSAERPSDYGLEDADDEDDDEGGTTMHSFIVDVLREALQTRTAWVLADLPQGDPDKEYDSRLSAERDGLFDPYLCIIPAEQIIDWQTAKRHRLEWVMMLTVEALRPTPNKRRKILLHTYTVWDEHTWRRYEIEVDPANPPTEHMAYQPVDAGDHGFGRVPFERLCLSEGLYAMGKLHSLAREHFNKRCAMSWAEYKSLFPILYEFGGAEDKGGLPVAHAQTDENRFTNQLRGQGYTQVRGSEDRAEYVGPPPEAFVAARESCNDSMREMHRVMFSMAMSANMDSAALRRSAESKGSDNATTEVLLDAFGTLLLRFCRRLLLLAGLGRQEAAPSCTINGLEKFDVKGIDTKIAEAVQLFSGVPMLSALVKELYLAKLYADIVGGDLTQEQLELMRRQIRDGISMEELAAAAMAGMGEGGTPGGGKDDDDDDDEPPPMPAPKPTGAPGVKPGRMMMTRRPMRATR